MRSIFITSRWSSLLSKEGMSGDTDDSRDSSGSKGRGSGVGEESRRRSAKTKHVLELVGATPSFC